MPDFSRVKTICFDVDSTVCADEGIDKLAAFRGKQDYVQKMYVLIVAISIITIPNLHT